MSAALTKLRDEGVEGPFAVVLNEQLYKDLAARTDSGYPILSHVKRLIDGDIVWAAGLDGGLVISLRGGDFELTVGQDFSIGYLDHNSERVRLYIEESFTFLVLTEQAAVPLNTGGGKKTLSAADGPFDRPRTLPARDRAVVQWLRRAGRCSCIQSPRRAGVQGRG